ncbi:hypothetical protein H4S02_003694 [Coemansia sp. RSA 2611]|nr:hypothetical protein H4S02_003694 [Coemansia sp. RSA 2611]
MWTQLALVAAAFGAGYYVARRGSGEKTATPSSDLGEFRSMVGAFPEQTSAESTGHQRDSTGTRTAKAKRKKAGKTARTSEPLTAAPVVAKAGEMEETAPEPPIPSVSEAKLEPEQAPESGDKPKLADVSETDEWQAIGAAGARPQKQSSNPIPVHGTAWSAVADDVDLSRDDDQQPSQHRILRIGAPSRPPPPAPVRREYTGPQPLTKKQRQDRKRAERRREERAQSAAIQDQRLRAHQRQQFDMRSREQWKSEQRKAMRGPPKGAAPSHAQGAPSLIDGKLIWD